MISKMGQSLTNFKQYGQSSTSSQNQFSLASDKKYNTARSFFSKDNSKHPSVQENQKLKQKLEYMR